MRSPCLLSTHVSYFLHLCGDFLLEQLVELAPPEEWVSLKVGGIAKSVFMRQLKKERVAFVQSGGLAALESLLAGEGDEAAVAEMTKSLGKKRMNMVRKVLFLQEAAAAAGVSGAMSSGRVTAGFDPMESARKRRRYPMEDSLLIQGGARPPPSPRRSQQLMKVFFSDPAPSFAPGEMEEALLVVYAHVNNFRVDLKLPFIALQSLQELLVQEKVTHPLLREVHIGLLATVLEEWINQSLNLNGRREGDNDELLRLKRSLWCLQHSTDFLNGDNSSEANSVYTQQEPQKAPPVEEQTVDYYREFLRVGDNWLEVLRVLVCERHQLPLREHLDPLAECRRIVETLMARPEAAPFSRPVDVDSLPGYQAAVDTPMDFSTVLLGFDSGR